MTMEKVIIVGGGLAGSEAAYFLASHGIKVSLYEMRPKVKTNAHQTSLFAELVCSNSLKSKELTNACGLLKAELTLFDSLMMKVANKTAVPGGNALCVDRDEFSQKITNIITKHPNIEIINEEITKLPSDCIVILATGPLTSPKLEQEIQALIGHRFLGFFDASSPIVEKDSINLEKAYFKSRYDQGDDAYLNCPFTEEEYLKFYHELINAKRALVHEDDTSYFDGCMPVEVIAEQGVETLRFGPLKPRGLGKTKEDRPYAVLQLRQDNLIGTLFNLVGFQTNLTYAEQERVFRLIPGLEEASFVRYGLMHRNTFVNAPAVLNNDMSLKNNLNIYIAGQLSGVEGYVESSASGLFVGLQVLMRLREEKLDYPRNTMLGSLMFYITHANPVAFAPMNANYGILPGSNRKNRDIMAKKALETTKEFVRKNL